VQKGVEEWKQVVGKVGLQTEEQEQGDRSSIYTEVE
jgi:hypothetical protein